MKTVAWERVVREFKFSKMLTGIHSPKQAEKPKFPENESLSGAVLSVEAILCFAPTLYRSGSISFSLQRVWVLPLLNATDEQSLLEMTPPQAVLRVWDE